MLCASRAIGASAALPPQCHIAPSKLCPVYFDQVDPVIKILHRPSLSDSMERGSQYLRYPTGHPAVNALTSAVCYAAVCSLTETACRNMFQAEKTSLLDPYRRACEIALEQSEVLVTGDTTVLQAFVLYIVSLLCYTSEGPKSFTQ